LSIVDRSLFNPHSNEPVRVGDAIGIHEWLGARGVWRYLGDAVVEEDGSSLVTRFFTSRTGLYSTGYRTVHCAPALLRIDHNTRGGALVAYQGNRAKASGMRVWRFPSGPQEIRLDEPPDFWRGTAFVYHGNQVVEIPYDGICGRTFDVELLDLPATRSVVTLEPTACSALRITNLPTLAMASRAVMRVPGTAPETLREAPYFRTGPRVFRDDVGRPVRLESTGVRGVGDINLLLVLGGGAWGYALNPSAAAPTVDISSFATETGLCVAR
jgi:hypothetical protein